MPEADEYTLRALQENLSLMAVDSITNKLLGVAINGVVTRDTLSLPQHEDFVRQATSPSHILNSPILNPFNLREKPKKARKRRQNPLM